MTSRWVLYQETPSTAAQHVRIYPLTGHGSDMAGSTRLTHQRHW
jgi:hypothetical protein